MGQAQPNRIADLQRLSPRPGDAVLHADIFDIADTYDLLAPRGAARRATAVASPLEPSAVGAGPGPPSEPPSPMADSGRRAGLANSSSNGENPVAELMDVL